MDHSESSAITSSSTSSSTGSVSLLQSAALVGVTSAALLTSGFFLRRWITQQKKWAEAESLVPLIEYSKELGKVKRIERFGEYVVRQLGIPPELASASFLAQAADDYVKGDKSKSDKSREHLLALATSAESLSSDDEVATLAKLLVEELDTCMLSYFGFHWQSAPLLIDQVLKGPNHKWRLRDVVLAITRQERFHRVVSALKSQQKLQMLVEEMKVLAMVGAKKGESAEKPFDPTGDQGKNRVPRAGEVLVPAEGAVRSPVLLLIGGGMGAGKSTAVKEIMKRCFWSKMVHNAVVVEADAFKEKDVIFRTLSSTDSSDVAHVAQLVHEVSTNVASATLVTALNEGRDVIFDGTMSWEPFVLQTIAMARDIHQRKYRMGPGYRKNDDGSVEERYWDPVDEEEEEEDDEKKVPHLPYRIEVVGVVCDAHLAVVRGMRRAILTRRGVPVRAQLRSHVLFASALEKYCQVADGATIYCTNNVGGPPQVIGFKDGGPLLVDRDNFGIIDRLKSVNCTAQNVLELYQHCASKFCPGETWASHVASSERRARQALLREKFSKVQLCLSEGASVSHGITSSTSFKCPPRSKSGSTLSRSIK